MVNSIDDEIMRTRETLRELRSLYWDLVSNLQAKQNELVSISWRLQALGWPGVMMMAYLGARLGEALGIREMRGAREQIEALLRRREVLLEEIMRERQELSELARQIRDVQAKLTGLVMRRERVVVAVPGLQPARRVTEWEINELFRLLEDPATPPDIRERVRKRLRGMGFRV